MKKIVLLMAVLAVMVNARAQKLYVNNTSCIDIDFIMYAGENPNDCGPTEDDKSIPISIPSFGSYLYDFNGGTGATGFTWNGSSSGTPSANLTGGNFNFFRADVTEPCGKQPTQCATRGGTDWGGTTVYNDMGGPPNSPCGSPTSSVFVIHVNCLISQSCLCVACCDNLPGPDPLCVVCEGVPGIVVSFTMSGGDWYLTITN